MQTSLHASSLYNRQHVCVKELIQCEILRMLECVSC